MTRTLTPSLLSLAPLLLALAACGDDGPASGWQSSGTLCGSLVAEYAAALPAAKACAAHEVCDASRPQALRGSGSLTGLGCSTQVTSSRAAPLDEILARFDAAGCKVLALPCPPPALEAPACGGDGRCP